MPRTSTARLRSAPREQDSLVRLSERFTHDQIEKGVAASIVNDIVAAEILSRGEVARLVPPRTLARRIAGREPLKTEEADAIGRLLRVTAEAERIFGDKDFAHKWLRLPVPSLKNRVPIELAQTDAGAREVETALIRFANGVYI